MVGVKSPPSLFLEDIPMFTIISSAIVDGEQWYTIQVNNHSITRFLLNKEKENSSKVVYIDSPWIDEHIYDVHISIYNLLVLKYG
jgi:hypothetical protein